MIWLPKPGELLLAFPSDLTASWATGAAGESPAFECVVKVYLWLGDTLRLVDEGGGGSPDTVKASSAVAAARCAIEWTTDVSMVALVLVEELWKKCLSF